MMNKLFKINLIYLIVFLFIQIDEIKSEKIKVFLNNANFLKWINEKLGDEAEILIADKDSDAEKVIKNADGVTALIWGGTKGPSQSIIEAAGEKLKLITSLSDGYDHYDIEYLKSKNIKLTHTPYVCDRVVSSLAIGLAIAAARNFEKASRFLHQGRWGGDNYPFEYFFGQDFENSTIGIVGFGRIGQETAKRIKVFNIKNILYYDRRQKKEDKELDAKLVTFEELLKESDFIFIHASLTNTSKGLFDENAFNLMKPNAVLVNTARGPIVKTDALIKALKENKIFAAGLDVVDPEPLPLDSELYELSNVVLTPHIGIRTWSVVEAVANLASENILSFIRNSSLISPVAANQKISDEL